jgi:hypothetical protein
MDLPAAIKREERKIDQEFGRLQNELSRVRAAAKALDNTAGRKSAQVNKHVMSAAARAKISKATKARRAKFRADKRQERKDLAERGGFKLLRVAFLSRL